jgi:hypothetical protein
VIPTKLLNVVENFGNGEFEMSFPLIHLKSLNTIANGLSNVGTKQCTDVNSSHELG